MTCKGQIAEQNANEHVLAIAPQGNLQLSPNFFWNFSHPIRMFLTLRQGFLTISLIFQTGLMYTYIVPSFSSPCNTKRLGNAILDWRANVGQFNRDKTSSQSFHVRQPWPKGGSNYSTKRLVIASTN